MPLVRVQPRRRFELAPTVAAKWSVSGIFKLRVEGDTATLLFDLTATAAINSFDTLCTVPTQYGLGSGGLIPCSTYRSSDGAVLTYFRMYQDSYQILGALASGTRLYGGLSWVLPI